MRMEISSLAALEFSRKNNVLIVLLFIGKSQIATEKLYCIGCA